MRSIKIHFLLCVVLILNVSIYAQGRADIKPREVYRSNDLIIIQVADHSYQHISFLQTNDFGNVPCNGLVVQDQNKAVVFDTPTNDKSATELIKWIKNVLHCKIKAIIPTHFHDDCLGGLNAFHEKHIPSYGFYKTIQFAKEASVSVPKKSFRDSLKLRVGKENVLVKFFGEGHSKDNVVGYCAGDNILFGGCLIKESGATKGYLGDANVKEWSSAVKKIKNAYSKVKIIVPGHGAIGGIELLDYTISLFKEQ